jgi:hypothetical protein
VVSENPVFQGRSGSASLKGKIFNLGIEGVVATLQDVHCRRKRDPEKRAISFEVSRFIARSERISPMTEENLNP